MSTIAPEEVAIKLHRAMTTRSLAAPEGLEGLTLDTAYLINKISQSMAIAREEQVVGYKIGLTSDPAQHAFSATEPAFGYVLNSTVVPSGTTMDLAGIHSPAVEVEVAFMLGAALTSPDLTVDDVMMATESIAPALEIVGSRWEGGACNLPMLVADNTNAVGVVLGEESGFAGDLSQATSTLEIEGRSIPGVGSAVLGNPCEAVAWLARRLVRTGAPLQAGQMIMSGTFSAPTPIADASQVSAEITGLGSVSVRFA